MEYITIICKNCEQEHRYPKRHYIQRQKTGRPHKIYCSRHCADIGKSVKYEKRHCVVCKDEFNCKSNLKTKCCSRKCADNLHNPKKKCGKCKKPDCNNITSNHRKVLCDICIGEGRSYYKAYNYMLPDELPLYKVIKQRGSNKFDVVRSWARKKMINSGVELKCDVCDYDIHVEAAHIKPLSTFSPDTLISEVNSFDNLRLMCRNHHWELDHGVLKEKISSPRSS
jgi:hypothetical protein